MWSGSYKSGKGRSVRTRGVGENAVDEGKNPSEHRLGASSGERVLSPSSMPGGARRATSRSGRSRSRAMMPKRAILSARKSR